jgi:hypothetical protein
MATKSKAQAPDQDEEEAPPTTFSINLSDVPPQIILEEDDYLVRVADVKFTAPPRKEGVNPKTKKPYKKYHYFNVRLEVVDFPTADSVFYRVGWPTDEDDEKSRLNKDRELKKFLTACGHALDGELDLGDLVGAEFMVHLVQREYDGKVSNDVKNVILED